MLALLRTRRWIGFTCLVVAVIIAFGLLSHWQWGRAETKRQERFALEQAGDVTPAALPPVSALPQAQEWNRFTLHGSFDAAHQVVVRKRPLNGTNGFWVMTPFTSDPGTRIWVNRGWFAAAGAATTMPVIPAPPTAPLDIVGAWRLYETATAADLTGLPTGMVPAPAAEVLPVEADAPGYLQLISPDQEGLIAVPTPEIDETQNFSYAVQWLLFALVSIVGWFIFLRREAAEDARLAAGTTGTSPQ